jgi:hypothetical protein
MSQLWSVVSVMSNRQALAKLVLKQHCLSPHRAQDAHLLDCHCYANI